MIIELTKVMEKGTFCKEKGGFKKADWGNI
jgi:hypothetical protein